MRTRRARKTWARAGLTMTAIGLAAAAALAQSAAAPQSPPEAQPAAPMDLAPAQSAVVDATEVLRIADVIASALATDGRIPTTIVVNLRGGGREALSAARLFVLLARFLGNGYEEGMTPEYVRLPLSDMIGPLERSTDAGVTTQQRVLATADLVAQARATADVAESTGHLPTGVWIAGARLTPAQFMGALATVLQYAAYSGEVPSQVGVAGYLPPLDWGVVAPLSPARELPAAPEDSTTAVPPNADGEETAPRLSDQSAAGVSQDTNQFAPPPPPRLELYLPGQGVLSGEQNLTIEYQGPPAFIRLSIDGARKAVANMEHFTYLWDTRLEPDGRHTIEVSAVSEEGEVLDGVETAVETANGNTPLH